MATDINALVHGFYEEIFNRQQVDRIGAFVAPTIVDHSLPPGAPHGIEGVREAVMMFVTAFPDLHLTLEDVIVEGEKAAVRWTMRGTHHGASLGMPPTGKQFSMSGVSVLRFEGEKVAESWIVHDQLSMLRQLGLLPVPAQVG